MLSSADCFIGRVISLFFFVVVVVYLLRLAFQLIFIPNNDADHQRR